MYNIAIWITENHQKLPKINSKQGCCLPREANGIGFNHQLWFDTWQTTKPSTNTHTWSSKYFYCSSLFYEVICRFCFCYGRLLDWSSRFIAFTYRWCCCSYFMDLAAIQVSIVLENKILISTIADPVNSHNLNHFGQWHSKNSLPVLNQNIVYCKLCLGCYIGNHLTSKMM